MRDTPLLQIGLFFSRARLSVQSFCRIYRSALTSWFPCWACDAWRIAAAKQKWDRSYARTAARSMAAVCVVRKAVRPNKQCTLHAALHPPRHSRFSQSGASEIASGACDSSAVNAAASSFRLALQLVQQAEPRPCAKNGVSSSLLPERHGFRGAMAAWLCCNLQLTVCCARSEKKALQLSRCWSCLRCPLLFPP